MTTPLRLDGEGLTLEALERAAMDPTVEVRLAPEAVGRMNRSRACIEDRIGAGEVVYGVTTGFGRLADVTIGPEDRVALQENLVRSHASGTGAALDRTSVRALMILRANSLARGFSGCRVTLVERLLDLVNSGVHPRVPEFGSVGASGDLAPLAHVAIALLGEGRAEYGGHEVQVSDLVEGGIVTPLTLDSKEGLALINGTQATSALGALTVLAAERAVETAEVAGAMSLEALLGTPEAFRREIQSARPHDGQRVSAGRLRGLLTDSEIRESHREGDPRVQDAYALRCMPQVHGAARMAFDYARSILETECNSATDNPLVFPDADVIVSGGNFHAQIVAQALDLVAIAAADLAAISERRIERLLNPDLSMGLPAFLTPRPGLESGFMIAQVTAVDLLSEMRVLAHPASVDSVTTSANQEDHVSMGMAAARKARRAVACLESVLAVEIMCAAQGIEYRRPLSAGAGVERAMRRTRGVVAAFGTDRSLNADIDALAAVVRSGVFADIAMEDPDD